MEEAEGTETEISPEEGLRQFDEALSERFKTLAGILEEQSQILHEIGAMVAHLPIEWQDELLPPIQEFTGCHAAYQELRYRFTKLMRSSRVALVAVEAEIAAQNPPAPEEQLPEEPELDEEAVRAAAIQAAVDKMHKQADKDVEKPPAEDA